MWSDDDYVKQKKNYDEIKRLAEEEKIDATYRASCKDNLLR